MVILILFFFLVVLSLIIGFNVRRTKKTFHPVLNSLGLKKKWFFLSYRINFSYQGEKIILDFNPTREKNIESLRILKMSKLFSRMGFELLTSCKSPFEFCVESKKDDKPFLHLFPLLKTGEQKFDDNFALTSDNDIINKIIYEKPQLRELITDIFNSGAKYITLEKNWLKIGMEYEADKHSATLKELPEYLLKLKNIVTKSLREEEYLIPKKVSRLPLIISYAFSSVFTALQLAYTIFLNYKGRNDFEVLSNLNLILISFTISLPYTLTYLYLSFRITSRYVAPYKKFVICIFLANIWFFASIPLVQNLNGYFDKSEPVFREKIVKSKYKSEGESYFVIFQDDSNLKPGYFNIKGRKLSLSKNEYKKVIPGVSVAKILVKKGALGIPWVHGYILYYDGKKKDLAYDYHFLGYKQYLRGDWDGAIRVYTEGIKALGGDATLYYNRGIIYRKKQKFKEAKADFQEAIKLKPDMFIAYKNLTWIIAHNRDWDQVVELWGKFIEGKPDDPNGYFERAMAYKKKKEINKSLVDLKKACELGMEKACRYYRVNL